MKRPVLIAAASLLLLGACTPGSSEDDPGGIAPAGQEATGTVDFWHFFTDREAAAIEAAIKDFEAEHPDIDVNITAGQDDAKMLQAISSGKGPDVGLSYSTDIVGKFCSSNAWRDLTPYIERDGVDLEQYSETVRSYTRYQDKRCAMPFLADAYGLYFNKTMLAQAGFTAPPKNMTELMTMAKALTKRAPDGTIEVAGFVPLLNFYEHTPSAHRTVVGSPVADRRREVGHRHRRGLADHDGLAQGTRRLVRLREPAEVHGRSR